MAKSQNQKLKLLYLWEYLTQQTSEEHPVSIKQIIAYLESQDIAAMMILNCCAIGVWTSSRRAKAGQQPTMSAPGTLNFPN
jgi:hypothetical protein